MKKHLRIAAVLAAVLAIGFAGSVSAHHVIDIAGDVDCDGYSVTVEANVFDNHRLVVRLDTTEPYDGADGVNVYNAVEPGANHDITVGPFTGPDFVVLVQAIIFAGPNTFTVENSMSDVFSFDGDCEPETEPTPTPTPEPTPTPTPEPTPTPTPTPCAWPHTPPEPCIPPVPTCEDAPNPFDCGPFIVPTPTPSSSVAPKPTLPPTDTAGPPVVEEFILVGAVLNVLALVLGIAVFAAALVVGSAVVLNRRFR